MSSDNCTKVQLHIICLGLILSLVMSVCMTLGTQGLLEASDLCAESRPDFRLNWYDDSEYPVAELTCQGQAVFRIRAPLGRWTVNHRGRKVLQRLRARTWCAEEIESVRPGEVNGYSVVLVADEVLVTVDAQTSSINKSTPEDLAAIWANNLRESLGLRAEDFSAESEESEEVVTMVASWYGDSFAGRRTASGEIFDPDRLTAAHRWLPFGTTLEVLCPKTDRSVVVVVNDRGPFAEGRDLDLSRAAAEHLGMVRRGVAQVKVFVHGK